MFVCLFKNQTLIFLCLFLHSVLSFFFVRVEIASSMQPQLQPFADT